MNSKLPNLFDLTGRIALVTGATRGIGLAIAQGLAAAGAKVYVHGRDPSIAAEIGASLGGESVVGDLGKLQDVQAIAQRLIDGEKRLDILVNNAAFEVHHALASTDLQQGREIFQVNCWAALELSARLLPLLEASKHGSIINVSSIHESVPVAGNGWYAMSKAALAMFTRTASVEWGKLGVRINNLAPGAILTDMNRALIADLGAEKWRSWIPLGRVGECRELIGPVLFLASDASSYMTGTTLTIDGAYQNHLVRYES